MPWIAVGGVGIVLAVVGAFMILDRQDSATPATSAASVTTTPSITPEEAADQLFNHVMTASEGGDNAEVQRFAPMALAAYDKLGTLDHHRPRRHPPDLGPPRKTQQPRPSYSVGLPVEKIALGAIQRSFE